MQFQLIDNEEVTEPITLAEVKAYSQIDADYSSDDAILNILISTARVRLEQYLNIGLAKRAVTLQWGGYPIDLPLSPNYDVVSLKDKDGEDVPTDDYHISEYEAKKIWVNSKINGVEYFYNINGSVSAWLSQPCNSSIYTLVYNTGYETLPAILKQALLAETDYLIKMRGMPVTDIISRNAASLASGYSRNLIL